MRRLFPPLLCALLYCTAATPAVSADEDIVSFRLINASKDSLCYLYLSPQAREVWSERSLGPNCLRPGEELTVRLARPGRWMWDFRIRDDIGYYRDYPPFDPRRTFKMTILEDGNVLYE